MTEAILYGHDEPTKWRLRHGGGFEFTTTGEYTRRGMELFVTESIKCRAGEWELVRRVYS